MAGKGPSGAVLPDLAMPTVLPTSHEKCPKSPGKRKYYNLVDAETAAAFSAQQYGKPMRAYVCDGCGLYHVTGKISYGDVTSSRDDGTIVTAGMSTRKAWKTNHLAPVPVERVDMSEIIAMETPIVAGNAAAREKLLAEWLEGKESTTMPDVMEFLQVRREAANAALNALGWHGARGQKEWLPPGVERVYASGSPKPESVARMNRRKGKVTTSRDSLRKSRMRKLKAYLADREEVATLEVMTELDCGKDMAKSLLHELGWNAGWGANARWTPGEDKLAHRRRVVPTPAELAAETKAEEPVNDPIDLAQRRHPAGSAVHEPISSEDAWRAVPDLEALKGRQVSQIIDELSVYGLEIRIQIREKHG